MYATPAPAPRYWVVCCYRATLTTGAVDILVAVLPGNVGLPAEDVTVRR
jgi:hypothetical protein